MKSSKNNIGKSRSDAIFEGFNIFFMLLVLAVTIYPLWFVLIASVSDPNAVNTGQVILYPKGFTWASYINVLGSDKIWSGYYNTIFNTFFGTLLNLALTIPCGYVLSKKDLPGRGFLSMLFVITMYFGGGMIPAYLNIYKLGLLDNRWTLVILGGISVYNMIIVRTYFQNSIPNDLYEAAKIDGASEFRTFFQIALPLAAPIVAVIALYYAVGRWNEYYNALIYINDTRLNPLQIVLRNILINNQSLLDELLADPTATDEQIATQAKLVYMAEGMKYAIIWVASLPMLILYPFIQKYFVKGVMIGSLKG